MARPSIRIALCGLVGLFAGGILGRLFVPDPTGTLALVLAFVLAVLITGGLYRTEWLRSRSDGAY